MIHTLGDKNTCHTIVHDIIILDQNNLKRNEGMTATTLLTPCCSLSRKAKWSRLRTKTTPCTTSPLSNTNNWCRLSIGIHKSKTADFLHRDSCTDGHSWRTSFKSVRRLIQSNKREKKANEEADNSQTFAAVSIKRKPALTCDTLNKTWLSPLQLFC